MGRWELGIQAPQPHHRELLCRLYEASAEELGLVAETAVPGGDHVDSEPTALPVEPDAGSALVDERARRDLLNQVERYWFGSELEDATEPLPSLDLRLVERPDAVDDPLDVGLRHRRTERPLPRGARIDDVYRRLGEQLLILGEPGAGKTTLLLQLGRGMLAGRRRSADPMPVVFHLASWASERRPLGRWLVDELYRRYGVARQLGQRWIDQEQILPLLDGLDEVADRHRMACVAAINQFHRDHGQLSMVVCCRTAWYESLEVRLALRGAVEILPLSRDQVRRCLDEAGAGLAGVRALLAEDGQLQELLTTPLFLGIAAVVYRDGATVAANPEGTLAERRRRLLGDYVDAMLGRASTRSALPAERTTAWLGWLARTMRAHDQSVFYPDWIQPSWLPGDAHQWLVTRGVSVGVGLASGLLVGLNWGADWGASLGPAMFAMISLTVGSMLAVAHGIVAHESRIVPAEQLHWSWAALRRGLPRWMGIGLAVGLLGGIVFGLVVGLAVDVRPDVLSGARSAGAAAPARAAVTLSAGLAAGVVSALANGVVLGLLVGLTFGLATGLDTRYGVTAMAPGQSVEASWRNALVGSIVGGCVFGLGYALDYGQGTSLTGPLVHRAAHALGLLGVYWPVAAPNDIVVAVLWGALVAGLQRGGGAYLRHRALMSILVRTGCAPRNYIAFLEHASRLVLLRRRGGGYEFIHRMLLEYFADLPLGPASRARIG